MKTSTLFHTGLVLLLGAILFSGLTAQTVVSVAEIPEGECDESNYLIPVEGDRDGDYLSDAEEIALGMSIEDPDEDQDGVPDGVQLALAAAKTIRSLDWFDAWIFDWEPPVLEFSAGVEELIPVDRSYVIYVDYMVDCQWVTDACGAPVTIGHLIIVNPALHASWRDGFEIPLDGWHYLQHGSFSYASNGCYAEWEKDLMEARRGRIDPVALKTVLDTAIPEICPGNLLQDGGFESAQPEDLWNTGLMGSVEMMFCTTEQCEEGAPRSGRGWLRFYNRITDDVLGVGQHIDVSAGRPLVLRFYARVSNPDAAGSLFIEVDNDLIEIIDLSSGEYSADYHEVRVSIPDPGMRSINLVISNPFMFGGDVYIDDVCLVYADEPPLAHHTGDWNGEADGIIDLTELLRVIQFYNAPRLGGNLLGEYYCAPGTEDGYTADPRESTGQDCAPHASDYNPQDWRINLSELLRIIQFYNSPGFYYCDDADTEGDGFCILK